MTTGALIPAWHSRAIRTVTRLCEPPLNDAQRVRIILRDRDNRRRQGTGEPPAQNLQIAPLRVGVTREHDRAAAGLRSEHIVMAHLARQLQLTSRGKGGLQQRTTGARAQTDRPVAARRIVAERNPQLIHA